MFNITERPLNCLFIPLVLLFPLKCECFSCSSTSNNNFLFPHIIPRYRVVDWYTISGVKLLLGHMTSSTWHICTIRHKKVFRNERRQQGYTWSLGPKRSRLCRRTLQQSSWIAASETVGRDIKELVKRSKKTPVHRRITQCRNRQAFHGAKNLHWDWKGTKTHSNGDQALYPDFLPCCVSYRKGLQQKKSLFSSRSQTDWHVISRRYTANTEETQRTKTD